MNEQNYFVYIITNALHTTLYVGMTNDLERRVVEHRRKQIEGFTAKYQLNRLLYYETTGDVWSALEREKQLKRWSRSKKEWLINRENPFWENLMESCLMEDFSTSSK
ncbi:MAG: GIY-YIG nuclease family protein [Patescibacteria group bacterium]